MCRNSWLYNILVSVWDKWRDSSAKSLKLDQIEWVLVELNNGQKMPILGIGTFSGFEAEKPMTTSEAVTFALKIGYRHIDCAYAHHNETEIGIAIKTAIHDMGMKR